MSNEKMLEDFQEDLISRFYQYLEKNKLDDHSFPYMDVNSMFHRFDKLKQHLKFNSDELKEYCDKYDNTSEASFSTEDIIFRDSIVNYDINNNKHDSSSVISETNSNTQHHIINYSIILNGYILLMSCLFVYLYHY